MGTITTYTERSPHEQSDHHIYRTLYIYSVPDTNDTRRKGEYKIVSPLLIFYSNFVHYIIFQ